MWESANTGKKVKVRINLNICNKVNVRIHMGENKSKKIEAINNVS